MDGTAMTSHRWNRIQALFEAARVLEPADRRAVLDREYATDAELRREVDSLLDAAARPAPS